MIQGVTTEICITLTQQHNQHRTLSLCHLPPRFSPQCSHQTMLIRRNAGLLLRLIVISHNDSSLSRHSWGPQLVQCHDGGANLFTLLSFLCYYKQSGRHVGKSTPISFQFTMLLQLLYLFMGFINDIFKKINFSAHKRLRSWEFSACQDKTVFSIAV